MYPKHKVMLQRHKGSQDGGSGGTKEKVGQIGIGLINIKGEEEEADGWIIKHIVQRLTSALPVRGQS